MVDRWESEALRFAYPVLCELPLVQQCICTKAARHTLHQSVSMSAVYVCRHQQRLLRPHNVTNTREMKPHAIFADLDHKLVCVGADELAFLWVGAGLGAVHRISV